MVKKEKTRSEGRKSKVEYNVDVLNLWREKYGKKRKDQVRS